MKLLLEQSGYVLNEELNIWSKPEYMSINYSDGDSTELRIKHLIDSADDVSVFSDELRQSCTDWPSLYHLSGTRANLLRVFDDKLSGDILEIGAGCGAITRYLGERGGRVLALEGSTRRASIARSRTRDLENVSILAEAFEAFDVKNKFDVVTLIGVFEYANLFTSGNTPALSMLQKVRSLLKPDGLLVIAIENQLGLKYFAGAPEDHVSTPMYGIEGRYNSATPETYGKEALTSLLRDAGFSSNEFFAPFPDYKLPVSIVTEEGFKDREFDASAFAWQSVRRDPQLPKHCDFSLELAWPQIFKNNLALDLSNSFLIGASPSDQKKSEKGTLAYHFSTDRRSQYCKVSTFKKDSVSEKINVNYKNLSPREVLEGKASETVMFNLEDNSPYIKGKILSYDLIKIINIDDWEFSDVAKFLSGYLEIISKLSGGTVVVNGQMLPGYLIDAVPQNIIIDENGDPYLIDKEWTLNTSFRVEYLLFRALLQLLGATTRLGRNAEGLVVTRKSFLVTACEATGYPLSDTDIKSFLRLESEMQCAINGRSPVEFLTWGEDDLVVQDDVRMALDRANLAKIESEQAFLSQLNRLTASEAKLKLDYESLINSSSWRITKPMRFLLRSFRRSRVTALNYINASKRRANEYIRAQGQGNGTLSSARSSAITEDVQLRLRNITVILPVYRDVEMTRRCIIAAMPGVLNVPNARLVAINDASPDAGMQNMLEEVSSGWPEVLLILENKSNLGFVKTVNRGMRFAPEDDIVFLNSDVIVPDNWLERLSAEAYVAPNIGTVTPFSNNATICSFPVFLAENTPAFDLSVEQIDKVFSTFRLPGVSAPTGVGFCMYVRRDCLDVVGLLNEEKFGRGYGEENDLCQRALKVGWHNLITPNLYAYHEGGVSFSTGKQTLMDSASQAIAELHPEYHLDIQRFIARDPLKSARVKRFAQLISVLDRTKVLHVSHEAGGGVQQHIVELVSSLDSKVFSLSLTPHKGKGAVKLKLGFELGSDELIFSLPEEHTLLIDFLRGIGVGFVHYHHSLGLNPLLLNLAADLNTRYALTVHDYYWLCANPTLTNERGIYPGKYSEDICNPNFRLPEGMSPPQWRAQLGDFIQNATTVIFPSEYTFSNYAGYYDFKNPVVAGHLENKRKFLDEVLSLSKKDRYTIGVIGALSIEKGADYLEAIVNAAAAKKLNIDFKLIGYGYRELKGLFATGSYDIEALPALIAEHQIDLAFFPSQCPETYSYTLSYALESGLPVIAPDIGAFPERLSGRESTLLYQYGINSTDLLEKIVGFIDTLVAGGAVTAPTNPSLRAQADFYSNEYVALCSDLRVVTDAEKSSPLSIPDVEALDTSFNQDLSTKEIALLGLWTLYRHPRMQWVNKVVPYSLRQKIKRKLTRRPLHEIVDLNKK